MPDKHPVPRAAFCEDYNEEEQNIVPETRKVANVAAKRSKAELTKPKASELRHDVANDSGYSSHTPAMSGSGGVAQAPKAAPVALRLDTAATSIKRRPGHLEKRSESTQRSPSKPTMHRSESKSQRKETVRHEHCQCKDCAGRGRSATTPLESPWPLDYYPFHQQRPRHDNPPSPQSARHLHPIYSHEIPIIHTVQPRPRAQTAQSTRARPMSFHSGMMPETMYIAPMYVERGPPPSTSAYAHSPSYPHPSYPPPGATFIPPPAPPSAPRPALQESYPQSSPAYAQPRPQPRQWTSDVRPSRRSSVYGRPVVEYEEQIYSAPPMERRTSSHRSHREHTSTPVDSEYFRDEDYYLMPPPKAIPTQRPPLRHLSTTTSNQSHARAASVEARVSDRSRRDVTEQSSRSRRPSLVTRPSTTSKKSTSYENTPGNAKISIESARQRPASYYGHERRHDFEAKQRESEEYQEAKGGKSTSLTADALVAARKGTKSSDSGSRASGSREGSDVKTRSVGTGSGVAAKGDADGFSMRFPAGAGVKVDFAGDSVDGKTISLRPSGADGLMELSVGGRESKKYHGSEGKQVDYARSGLRREMKEPEELRRTREEMKSARGSRRSSRSGYSGRGQVE